MANEFIIRKGYKSLSDSQITGSLSVSNAVTASFFTGSFRGDGSELTGIDGFPFTGSASISGSLTIVGPVTATEFIGNGSQLTGIEGFPYTGSAIISGSLQVTGSISTDTDAIINSLTVGKGGGNLDTNTAVGYNAFSSNTGGNFNVAIGYNALASSVEGDDNVAIGHNALSSSLASMGPNTAVGRGALQNNLYGFRNTAIGNASLFSNIQGDFNTAVGNTALLNNIDGHENIAIGDGALYDNTVGDYNTGVGTFAIHSNTGGNNNTAIGHSSLYYNLTGSNNIALGTDAGLFAGSGFTGLASVDNSIFVGYRARALNAIGDTNEIVIGHNIVGLGSNTTVIGNNNTVSTTLKGAVSASLFSGSFVGDGSQLTGIADPTPITATIDNTDSPFTITNETIVIVDSTNGNVTVNLPDLNTIVGTENQKPIVIYKNDYSQNVIFVSPSGSQLVNGASQDIIVSIQLAVIYNPTSAGWVTEGTSAQSLAELELFFVPRTETGSFATTGSNTFIGNQIVTGSLTVTGGINATITGSATSSSYVEYTNVANKPTLVSSSAQISFNGITDKPALVSSSAQIVGYNIFATTGSNQFNGSQAITGSLTVTGQVVAQTLNVQQVTSSIVYSSGSNIFGNSLSNTQQFTGSVSVTGSLTSNGALSGTSAAFSSGATFGSTVRPITNFAADLGTSTFRWADIFGYALNLSGGTTVSTRLTIARGSDDSSQNLLLGWNSLTVQRTSVPLSSAQTDFSIIQQGSDGSRTPFYISTGGNVGIGTTSVSGTYEKLAVAGGISIKNDNNAKLEIGRYSVGVPNSYIKLGTSSNSLRFTNNTDAADLFIIENGGNVGIGTNSPNLSAAAVGSTVLSVSTSTSTRNSLIEVNGARTGNGDYTGYLRFFNNAAATPLADIQAIRGSSDTSGDLAIATSNTERMRITSEGDVLFNRTARWSVFGDSGGGGILSDASGTAIYATYDGAQSLGLSRRGSDGAIALFRRATTTVGTISVDSSSTAYNTSSDYRLKEDLKQINGLEKLSAIKVYDFKWKISEKRGDGVLAHELAEVLPYAVHGEKDGEQMQGVDYSKIVPVLVKSIQEQQTQIESLKAEIQTLKQ